jgi:hypothetical protein
MNYPNELCQLVIRNMEVIEKAPEVVEATEKRLFAAMNARVEKAVKAQKSWKGCYDLVTDNEDEETSFAPKSWPENEDESYGAYYSLTHTEDSGDYEWLSCATGVMGAALCFAFTVDSEDVKEYKKALESFYAGNSVLQKAGFSLSQSKKSSVRPFTFASDALEKECPDFDEALAPLDAALEDLFKAHGEFDKFVKKLK